MWCARAHRQDQRMQSDMQMNAESQLLVCLASNEECGRPEKTLLAKRTQTRRKHYGLNHLRQIGAPHKGRFANAGYRKVNRTANH